MVKKIISVTFFSAISLFIFANLIYAQSTAGSTGQDLTSAAASAQITTDDLGIPNPGILPTNPFYFFKEWQRSARLVFTRDPLKRVGLELRYLNEKAAEIKKMSVLNSNEADSMGDALIGYESTLNQFNNDLNSVVGNTNNPDISDFIDQFIDLSFKHTGLFEDLKVVFADSDQAKNALSAAEDQISASLVVGLTRLDTSSALKDRLERIVELDTAGNEKLTSTLIKARFTQFLLRLKTSSSPDMSQAITEARNDLLDKVKHDLSNAGDDIKSQMTNAQFLEQLPADEQQFLNDMNATSTMDATSTILNTSGNKFCAEIYDPVCGVDQKTYPNSCFAGLANVKVDYKGQCKEDKGKPQAF